MNSFYYIGQGFLPSDSEFIESSLNDFSDFMKEVSEKIPQAEFVPPPINIAAGQQFGTFKLFTFKVYFGNKIFKKLNFCENEHYQIEYKFFFFLS